MSKRKITLETIKDDLKNDTVFKSAPGRVKQAAILYALEEIEKAPEKYELTPKTKAAIIKYANSFVKESKCTS